MKRKFTAPLLKTGRLPSLRKRHRVYETLEDNTEKPLPINILLTKYVESEYTVVKCDGSLAF